MFPPIKMGEKNRESGVSDANISPVPELQFFNYCNTLSIFNHKIYNKHFNRKLYLSKKRKLYFSTYSVESL